MNLVNINLHGKLGKNLGIETWDLHVSSVSEAIHAINKMPGGKLCKLLGEDQKKNQKE